MHLSSARTSPVRPRTGAVRPIGVGRVRLDGGFWGTRQELATRAIVPHAMEWMRRLGWIQNFESAAARGPYEHRGREFADSEVYKLIEAMSWDIGRGAEVDEETLERLIGVVLAAQEPDGYLHTLFGRPWQRPRYSDFQWGHELYCFGHFLQAAVAHVRATGDTRLCEAARRLADHVCTMFGADGLNRVCGHAEIELGLVELYRETGVDRYLEQARIFIERRGTGTIPLHEFGQAFWQDDLPVRDADVLRGHAVRALYLAAGAADVAVETGDAELLEALRGQWARTVARRTYITGGMGSHHMDEAFGEDFVLPPDRSYCESCAGVASVMFSWRLLLATGEAKYAELIERTLFNVIATCPSRDGRSFFYANTLHQRGTHTQPAIDDDGVAIRGGASGRQPWFEVSCCPPNVARTLAGLGAYAVTESDAGVQIHQYLPGSYDTAHGRFRIESAYPDEGRILVQAEAPMTIGIRVPTWAEAAVLRHGECATPVVAGAYAECILEPGATAILEFALEPRRTSADERIDAIRGCVAFERGPEVLALESVDLPEQWALEDVVVTGGPRVQDGDTVVDVALRSRGGEVAWPYGSDRGGRERGGSAPVRLTRYHDWAERGPSTMRVWIPLAG
ncbi:MAG: glycoside hydrolase family 127 protein [Actinobacteria bacterium]|nr:glycoside hydrolase family 127 protein [Actinomycetota bacterium]